MYGQLSGPTKLHENDFNPSGYKATSAFGGYEMQVDNRGETTRLRNSAYWSKLVDKIGAMD